MRRILLLLALAVFDLGVPVLAEGGTKEVDVPRSQRQAVTLDEAKIREIAQLAMDLERERGWPVDLEFAYQSDDLYLLQCRPITTL